MSRDHVEVVRRALAAFNRSDALWGDYWTEDCEFVSITADQIEGASYRGQDGLRRYAEDRLDAWEELRFEPDEFIDAGEQMVVVGLLTRAQCDCVPVCFARADSGNLTSLGLRLRGRYSGDAQG